jgi:hypothetical protein
MKTATRPQAHSPHHPREAAPAERRLIARIKSEFLEMPGLDLTLAQAQRLWGLDRSTCETLCDRLLGEGFLDRTKRNSFVLCQGRRRVRHAH